MTIKQFVLNHMGFAILPSFVIEDELKQGELVQVLADAHNLVIPLYAVYQNRTLMPKKVRVLLDFLKEKGI